MKATDMLRKAADLIEHHEHGRDMDGETSVSLAARMFTEWKGIDFTERDAGVFLSLLKLARARHGQNPDNWLDGAAYVAMAGAAELAAELRGDTSSSGSETGEESIGGRGDDAAGYDSSAGSDLYSAGPGLYRDMPAFARPDCDDEGAPAVD